MRAFLRALQRHPSVLVVVVVLAAILLATPILVLQFWPTQPQTTSDRIAVEGVILTGAAFLLAVVAAFIAAIAYVQSLHRPHLRVTSRLLFFPSIQFGTGDVIPQQVAQAYETGPGQGPAPWLVPPSILRIELLNTGEATARNVVVVARIDGLHMYVNTQSNGWGPAENHYKDGWIRLQWDGGTDLAVHPGGQQKRVVYVEFDIGFASPLIQPAVSTVAFADNGPAAHDDFRVTISPPRSSSVRDPG
ncbi:MAG TPA: hypothetical protein VND88_03795 [Candidatus Acidoferrales bacterium]|nr:hypothetical protein [Candidatus Acidoferrales bacterium]